MFILNKAMDVISQAKSTTNDPLFIEDLNRIRDIIWEMGLEDGLNYLTSSIHPYRDDAIEVITSLVSLTRYL